MADFATKEACRETQSGGQHHRVKGPKKCNICDRRFHRTEHLLRHQRIHTQEAPFSCPHCHRTFQRLDVQVRHTNKYCPQSLLLDTKPGGSATCRVRVACDACRRRKLKCSGKDCCSSCENAGLDCRYTQTRQRRFEEAEKSSASDHQLNTALAAPRPLISSHSIAASSVESNPNHEEFALAPDNGNSHLDWRILQLTNAASPVVQEEVMIDAPPDCFVTETHGFRIPKDATATRSSTQTAGSTENPFVPPQINATLEDLCEAAHSTIDEDGSRSRASVVPYMQSNNLDVDVMNNYYLENVQFTMEYGPSDFFDFSDPLDLDFSGDLGLQSRSSSFGTNNSAYAALRTLQKFSRFSRASSPNQPQDATHWLLTIPSIDNFDRDVLNIFVSLFMIHVAPTFTSFLGFKVSNAILPEQVLAMAAVGGLFCTIDGSFSMSRAMCSESRRLRFGQSHATHSESRHHQISIIQTHIVIELFGIFSGDKRLFECSEAFHMQLLEAVSWFHVLNPPFPEAAVNDARFQSIIEDVHLLECYRVILFQRSPNVYANSTYVDDLTRRISRSLHNLEHPVILDSVRVLMTPDGSLDQLRHSSDGLYTLAALLVFSWHALPIGPPSTLTASLWKAPYFELCLDRWLKAQENPPKDSTMLVFHLGSMLLHTNMATIHRFTQNFLKRSVKQNEIHALETWQSSDNCKIAVMHVDELIKAARRITLSSRPSFSAEAGTTDTSPKQQEPLHTAICVYLGVLTQWAAQMRLDKPNRAKCKEILETGSSILSRLSVRIASVLVVTLIRLGEMV